MMIPGMNMTSTSNRMRKNYCGTRDFDGSHMWHNGKTSGRMLKKAVQQDRSERRGEAYASVR